MRSLARGFLVLTALLLVAPAAQAAFPGANGKVVFWDDRGQPTYGIYTMNPDGTDVRKLIDIGSPSNNPSPAWSPDGSKITFSWNLEIHVMNADGSGVRQVTNTGRNALQPSWSPDGTQLLYVAGGALWMINTDGTGPVNLNDRYGLPFGVGYPVWSPDGSKIAFAGFDSDYSHVYVINADGTGLTGLTSDSSSGDAYPDWSPDGAKIVFWKRFSVPEESVYTIDADGSGQTFVTQGFTPAWSPDGSRIVFGGGSSGGVTTANLDGSGATSLGDGFEPDWQPIPSSQKNSAKFCKAERSRLGEDGFRQRYGIGGNGSSAFGQCVRVHAQT